MLINLLFIFCLIYSLQPVMATSQFKVGSEKTALELYTTVSEINYCLNDDDFVISFQKKQTQSIPVAHDVKDRLVMRVKLKYKFVNKGQTPIILNRTYNIMPRVMISLTEQDAMEKRYLRDEKRFESIVYPVSTDAESYASRFAMNQFVILQPGESYMPTEEREWHLNVKKTDNRRQTRWNKDELGSGEYYLQIVIEPWTGTEEEEERIREQWTGKGYLWRQMVISQPMKFTIEQDRVGKKCEE